MADSATTGCQAVWLLKSRRIAETRPIGPPFGEGAVAVGHGGELERSDVVVDAHRAFEDRVGALVVVVRQGEQLLADHAAVLEPEVAHAADLVGRLPALDARFGDERRPR